MTYLLDTNILIFLIEESYKKISLKQMEIITNPDNKFVLSEASLFEIGIKIRGGKGDFSNLNIFTLEEDYARLKISLLKSKPTYYTNIPKVAMVIKKDGKIHGDPFDLLIISQAMVENLPVLSSDEYFPSYKGITTIR
jgi:PIN domain nuclease of toxin-antitoxin system